MSASSIDNQSAARDTAPPDRFCDLVLKGGITSGIVYPPAVAALASRYRFKSIGGTSAGAIAAVVAAAAKYQRRQTGSMAGFQLLEKLPSELAETSNGHTRLFHLFQPHPDCRRLYRVLQRSLNRATSYRRIAAFVFGCIEAYWGATLIAALLCGLIWKLHSLLAALLLSLPAMALLIAWFIYLDLTRNVVRNDYGMCTGLTTDPSAGEALTPWLHRLVQRAAGRTVADPPLTFGDLWNANGFPPASLQPRALDAASMRSIDLQMFTTNLAHGRPYIFPHSDPTARLFYRADELARYLPAEVMQWVGDHALDYQPSQTYPHSDPPVHEAARLNLKELPPAERLPVLLAARMSLSFPLLFCAVPLWAIDYEAPRGARTFRRCMFSDGGISSNFPMHLFDGLLTMWPTFGIQLEDKLPERDDMVYLPGSYGEGFADHWTRFDAKPQGVGRFGGFLMSIASTMQNWNDNTLARMPGVRDRVARVRLRQGEGGLNLDMEQALIMAVACRGQLAAQRIVARFLPDDDTGDIARGWDEQRWVRLDVLLSALTQRLSGVQRALADTVPQATSYRRLIKRSTASAPAGHPGPLSPEQKRALIELVDALEDLAERFAAQSAGYAPKPHPQPELRVRPPL